MNAAIYTLERSIKEVKKQLQGKTEQLGQLQSDMLSVHETILNYKQSITEMEEALQKLKG